nr:outer membrane beta-barrel protein [Longimonas halophila]
MKRYTWTLILLALLLLPVAAQAQTSVAVGPKAGIGLGDVEDPFIGADVRIGLGDAPVRINPFFNFYFAPENTTFWEAGAHALVDFEIENSVIMPYAGAGAQIFSSSYENNNIGNTGGTGFGFDIETESSSTDIGLSGVGGVEFNLNSGLRPFVQGELGIIFSEGDSGTLFGLSGGVLFDL